VWLLIFLASQLYGCGGGGSGFDLLPNPPTVGAASVTAVPKNALVTANINPNGDSTEYWVEYGTGPALGKTTAPNTVGNGEQTLVVTDALTDLTPATVYYYRVVASSSLHIVTGSTQTFATPAIPAPVVLTAAPSSVTAGACTLNGTVNPNGFATSAWFEWGIDANYGNTTPQQSLGDGAQEIPYSQPLDKLSSKTLYHYRAVAQNEGGAVRGQDTTCATDSSIVLGADGSPADADGDGLSDSDEVNIYSTNPLKADTDGDGLNDGNEVKIYKTDPRKADSDGDGLSDVEELSAFHTDPLKADSDGDGLSDGNEVKVYHSDPLKTDSDGDSLSDGEEVNLYHTDPTRIDSDGDGLSDGGEVTVYKTDPAKADTDGDGIADDREINTYHTDPLKADSDGEGLSDGDEENIYHTNPLNKDTDGDTLDDYQEVMVYHTDPNNPDTDGDGISDGNEVRLGKDPLVPDSVVLYPDLIVSSLTGPQGAIAGQQLSVTITIKNSGALDATAMFDVGIYLSMDTVIDGGDVYVGKRRVSGGVLAGGSDTGGATINIPIGLTAGVYYLGAVDDVNGVVLESDETNNAATAAATLSVATGFDGGDGSDGSVTISGTFDLTVDSSDALGNVSDANGAQTDGFTTALTADAVSGATSLTVASTAGFVAGDEVMIIQLIHDSNHGVYEFKKNVTVSGTTLTFAQGLANNYYATGTTAKGTANTVQVVRVPHYSTLAVPAGTTLTTGAFNTSTRLGGILALRATTATVDGTIQANAAGLPAGAAGWTLGQQGWSYPGQGSVSGLRNAGGGSGGYSIYDGGSGGGYGTAGAVGHTYGGGFTSGQGGAVHGDAQLSRLYLGSGGGAGSAGTAPSAGGGRGGGVIYLGASSLTLSGTGILAANDDNGSDATAAYAGGGGSSVFVAAVTRTISGSMTASGGAGGRGGQWVQIHDCWG